MMPGINPHRRAVGAQKPRPHRTADGRIAGFRSLRVILASELEQAGVSPRTIVEILRHTDYRLAGGAYTDPRVIDSYGAVGKLPDHGAARVGGPRPDQCLRAVP